MKIYVKASSEYTKIYNWLCSLTRNQKTSTIGFWAGQGKNLKQDEIDRVEALGADFVKVLNSRGINAQLISSVMGPGEFELNIEVKITGTEEQHREAYEIKEKFFHPEEF